MSNGTWQVPWKNTRLKKSVQFLIDMTQEVLGARIGEDGAY